jgi:CheY-like chemotaxis protein
MADREKSSILLIDDDTSLLVTLGDFLSFEGYEVVTAASGEQGLDKLAETEPDLIILDMSMPGMGGVGFLKEISTPDGKPRYPVLVLTARANMAEFFANVEVDGFVAKPCHPEDLLMEVGRIIFLRKGSKPGVRSRAGDTTLTVLVGEDDPKVLQALQAGFEREGHVFVAVTQGPEVLEKAIVTQPDVILVKRILSAMNGDAVAGMLAQMPNTKRIPVALYDHGNVDEPAGKYTRSGSGVAVFVRSHEPADLIAAAKQLTTA